MNKIPLYTAIGATTGAIPGLAQLLLEKKKKKSVPTILAGALLGGFGGAATGKLSNDYSEFKNKAEEVFNHEKNIYHDYQNVKYKVNPKNWFRKKAEMRNIDLFIKEAKGWKNLKKKGKAFFNNIRKNKPLMMSMGGAGIIGAGIGVNMLMKGNGSDKKFREQVSKMHAVKRDGMDVNKAVKAKYTVK